MDGKQYAIPYLGMCLLLYYNKDHRRSAGLSPDPSPDWTWDEFNHDAIALTRDIDGDGRIDQFAITRLSWFYCLQWIWSAGGSDMDAGHTRYTFDTPEAKRGFQFHYDHMHKYKVCPQMSDLPNMSTEAVFLTGKVSMIYNGAWWLSQARLAKNFEWDVAHMPIGPVCRATRSTSEGIAITPQTPYKEEAWQWINSSSATKGSRSSLSTGEEFPPSAAWRGPSSPTPRPRSMRSVSSKPSMHMPATAPCTSALWRTEAVFNREWDRVYLGQIDIIRVCGRHAARSQQHASRRGSINAAARARFRTVPGRTTRTVLQTGDCATSIGLLLF